VEAAEPKDITVRHVLPAFLSEREPRHRLVQNAGSRSNSETASLRLERTRPSPSHARLIAHAPTRTDVDSYRWAAQPMPSSEAIHLVDGAISRGLLQKACFGLTNRVRQSKMLAFAW